MRSIYCVVREHHLRKANMSLASTIKRALIVMPAAMLLSLVVGFVVIGVMVSAGIVPKTVISEHQPSQVTPQQTWNDREASDRAERDEIAVALMHHFHCWGREAPADMAGQIPGGVVAYLGGQQDQPNYYTTPVVVGAALDHIFKNAHPSMTVYGFCRGDQHSN